MSLSKFMRSRKTIIFMAIFAMIVTSFMPTGVFAGGGPTIDITVDQNGNPIVTITGSATIVYNGVQITNVGTTAPAPQAQAAPPTTGNFTDACAPANPDGSATCAGGVLRRASRIDIWKGFMNPIPASCAKLEEKGDAYSLRCEPGTDLSKADRVTYHNP